MQYPTVGFDAVTLSMPNGTTVFQDLSVSFRPGITALTGRNGLGKSVLLRLLAGELTPTAGTVTAPPDPAYLPQQLTLRGETRVARLLGVAPVIDAIAELSGTGPAGSEPTAERAGILLELIGDDWDVQERALAMLASMGLPRLAAAPDVLSRSVATLSGGEAMLVALAGLRSRQPALTLLDEPSNNLDAAAREALAQALSTWPGTVIVSTHDRALLRRADAVAELRPRQVRAGRARGTVVELFGGWDEYVQRREGELSAARRRLAGAKADHTRAVASEQAAATRAARTAAQGRKAAQSMPKVLANTRRAKAQASAGDSAALHAAQVDRAAEAFARAREELAQVEGIELALPPAGLGTGTVVLQATVPEPVEGFELVDDGVPTAPGAALTVRGPEVIALTGPNGAGKTTLLHHLEDAARVPLGFLRQRTGLASGTQAGFDERAGALENLLRLVPGSTQARLRELLAGLALRAERVLEPVGRLSGGERFRVDLARVLAADPVPQLLVLDEPSNDLDLESVQELAGALAGYDGAVIVVSHDEELLAALGVTRRWELTPASGT